MQRKGIYVCVCVCVCVCVHTQASLMAQLVKDLPTVQEAWVQSMGWEDTLEEGKATHSSISGWRIPRTV